MSYQQPPRPSVDRTACGVIALVTGLLGFSCFGIHKFLMGKTSAGLLTILFSVLSCGLFGIICGIVEGIIYLTKSDDQWYQEYFIQGKDWF